MKRLVSVLLCLSLMLMGTPCASALKYNYSTTEEFTDFLEEEEIPYKAHEVGKEYDTIELNYWLMGDVGYVRVFVFFEDNVVSFLADELFAYDDELQEEMPEMMNTLNIEFSYLKWLAKDGIINARMDLLVQDDESTGEILYEALDLMLDIIGYAYEDHLKSYVL